MKQINLSGLSTGLRSYNLTHKNTSRNAQQLDLEVSETARGLNIASQSI